MIRNIFILITVLFFQNAFTQLYPGDFVKVTQNNVQILNPWSGGLDLPQFSTVDFNKDGLEDIAIFDKKGNKFLVYLKTENDEYKYAPQYESIFPSVINMGMFRDFNCDGNMDLFAHSTAGIQVFKNTSSSNNVPVFTLEKPILEFFTGTNYRNIYKYNNDIPAIEDFDNDGDLDILSFDVLGTTIPLYINTSVEDGYGCDSLIFEELTACWGEFKEGGSDNSIELDFSCKGGLVIDDESMPKNGGSRHVGSTLLAFDYDEDDDKDLILGDIAYSSIIFLNNGGTSTNAEMNSFDTNFPSYDTPADVPIFPAAFYLDVTHDGDKDLIVAPNSKTLHVNTNNVWLYENTGNVNSRFNFVKNDFLVDESIDMGSFSSATFFDYNGDSLLDIVAGNGFLYTDINNSLGTLFLYENIGTASEPAFELVTDDYQNLSQYSLEFIRPTFGDIDGDGDKDMLVGEVSGNIHAFENVASAGQEADFQLQQLQIFGLDVGAYSHPQLVDLNQDGLLDLVVGEQADKGNVSYYWNFGTETNAEFSQDSVNAELGGIHVEEPGFLQGYSAPLIVEDTIFVGSDLGFIHKYRINRDSLKSGIFTKIDSSILKSKVGIRSTLAVADLNSDNFLDFIVGNSRGGFHLYSKAITDSSLVLPIAEISEPIAEWHIFPNPTSNILNIDFGDFNQAKTVRIFNAVGEIVYQNKFISNSAQIPTSDFFDGIYFVELISDGKRDVKKLLVK